MATGTANSSAPQQVGGATGEAEQFIQQQLDQTRRRVKMMDLATSLMTLIAGVVGFLLATALVDHWVFELGFWGRLAALTLLVGGAAWYFTMTILPLLLYRINPVYAAQAIERSSPSLKNSLINFLMFRSNPIGVHRAVYQEIERRAATDLRQVDTDAPVDRRRLLTMAYLLVGVLALCAAYRIFSPKNPFQSFSRVIIPWADIERPSRLRIVDVLPGEDQEVYYGQNIDVSAGLQVHSGDRVPMSLVYSSADGQVDRREVEMEWLEEENRYRTQLPGSAGGIQQDLTYKLVAGDATAGPYKLRTIAAPTILVQKVDYQPPRYTGQSPRTSRQPDIRGLEGTQVTVHARANQTIQSAFIQFDPERSGGSPARSELVEMSVEGDRAWGSFILKRTADGEPAHQSYQVWFLTENGAENGTQVGARRSENPLTHTLSVTPDLPPVVDILNPTRSQTELPLDSRLQIEVRALDPDFGLSLVRLRAVSGGDVLLDEQRSFENRIGQVVETFDFVPQQLNLAVGDVVKYRAAAEDNRQDTQRNVASPNIEQTAEHRIIITEPRRRENTPDPQAPDQPEDSPEDSPSEDGNTPQQGASQSSDSADGNQDGEMDGEMDGESDPNADSKEDGDESSEKGSERGSEKGSEKGGQNDSAESGDPDMSGSEGGESSENASEGSPMGDSGAGGKSGDKSGDMTGDMSDMGSGGSPGGNQGERGAGPQDSDGGGPQSDNSSPADSPGRPTGQPGEGDGPVRDLREDPLHDGEVIERVQEYLENQQQEGTESNNKPRTPNSPANSNNSNSPSDPSPSGTSPTQDPASDNARPPGSAPQDRDQQRGQGEQRPGADSERGGEPQGPLDRKDPETKPDSSDAPMPRPGQGDNGQSGAGKPAASEEGAAQSQGENRDRQKKMQPGNEPASREPMDPQSPSNSKNQSDSEGDQNGDRSGGGGQGGGQSTARKGNDSAGSQSDADQGAGASDSSGDGETAQRPGEKQQADQPTGAAGSEAGPGSSSRPRPDDLPTADDSNSPKPGEQQPGSGNPQRGARSDGTQPAGNQGQVTGGGVEGDPSKGNVSRNPSESPAPPPAEAPNLEYAEKATDLVLEHLEDQQQNPDPKLLDELGWTEQDLKKFVERWKNLKQSANQGSDQQLRDALKSLGLKPGQDRVRRATANDDQFRGLRQSGNNSAPPPAFLEQFNAAKRGVAKGRSND